MKVELHVLARPLKNLLVNGIERRAAEYLGSSYGAADLQPGLAQQLRITGPSSILARTPNSAQMLAVTTKLVPELKQCLT